MVADCTDLNCVVVKLISALCPSFSSPIQDYFKLRSALTAVCFIAGMSSASIALYGGLHWLKTPDPS
jgi:hypothetical protein